MKKKLIIFGTGDIAQIANYYFEIDSNYEVVAFTIHKEFLKEGEFEKKPVIPFEEIVNEYPPAEHDFFIAISYSKMNHSRADILREAKEKGYSIASYISSKCTYLSQFQPGENAFIFEDNTIQPFVKIGDNVTIWSGNHIGHHSEIKSHNFISSHVVISGHCTIEEYCFLGVNSTIGHNVTIAKETLLGAGSIVTKNTEEQCVYLGPKPFLMNKKSIDISL